MNEYTKQGFSMNAEKRLYPLPSVTGELAIKVLEACQATKNPTADIFMYCMRSHGILAIEIAVVVKSFFPNLGEIEPMPICLLSQALQEFLEISEVA